MRCRCFVNFSCGDAVFLSIFCGVAVFRTTQCPPLEKNILWGLFRTRDRGTTKSLVTKVPVTCQAGANLCAYYIWRQILYFVILQGRPSWPHKNNFWWISIERMALQDHILARFNWIALLNMERTFKSPRPTPNIVSEATFSHRKQKRNNPQRKSVEEDCLPPRAPVKSAPPISRVFKHTGRNSVGALQVSFRENGSSILLKFCVEAYLKATFCSDSVLFWSLLITQFRSREVGVPLSVSWID